MQVISRSTFLAYFGRNWRQGEHVTLIGPTGSGKTTLGLKMLSEMKYVSIIATKQSDDTLSSFAKRNKEYRIIKEYKYDTIQKTLGDKFIVWPKLTKDAGDISKQAIPIRNSLNTLFFQGGWSVFADELWLLTNRLKLSSILESYWSQGRSSGLSIIGCVQRPAFIPRMAFSEPRHLLIGQMEDKRDIETVSNGTNINQKTLVNLVNQLSRHSFLYYNRDNRTLVKIDE